MKQELVLTVLSDDKPGVVETLAQVISNQQGNWLESRLSHLAGKFAGILQVSIDADKVEALRAALQDLEAKGIRSLMENAVSTEAEPAQRSLHFKLIGSDRPGIVYEITRALASHHINLEELHTDYSSMPWSGEPMFEASGLLQVPETIDTDNLYEQLDEIADELGVDFTLDEAETAAE